MQSPAGNIATLLIDAYRLAVSPLLPLSCRFEPTCSCYARQAIQSRGLLPGLYLAARRILKCHPFHPGGYDPVLHDTKTEGR